MKYIVLLIESFLYFLNIEMIMTKIMGYRKKNCVYLFFVFLLYPVLIIVRIINEENVLEKELKGYVEYKKKVKYRLIPFIW